MSGDTKNNRLGDMGQQRGVISTSPRSATVCRVADPLSETGVLRILNEPLPPAPAPAVAVSPRPTAARAAHDITETTSLRLIAPPERTGLAPCPRCGRELASDITICPRCRTRLTTSSKAWQAVYRAAARALTAR